MSSEKIIDYASGLSIKSTPEEIDATQPLSKELIEIFGYKKKDLVTRPQQRITTPGGGTAYFADIVVKENNRIKIVCECKRQNVNEGRKQLEKYLNLTEAIYGIWFNGTQRIYLKKIFNNNKIEGYKEIISIPFKGKTTIKNIKKLDLKGYDNLINIFREIHSYISTNEVGKNTGIEIAENFIKILFCKIYDERFKKDNDLLSFYFQNGDTEDQVAKRISNLFETVKKQYSKVFEKNEKIDLSNKTIAYIVTRLNFISLMKSSRDAISNAFEVFVGNALKGEQGQFFTPRNVVRFILNLITTKYKKINDQTIVADPACGTGGFIVEALEMIWKDIKLNNSDLESVSFRKNDVAQKNIFGFDINSFVAKVTKAYMCIMGDGTSNVYKTNSLKDLKKYYGTIDLVITNPPFGKKIKIEDKEILDKYSLSKMNNSGYLSATTKTNPEILFIELCIKLLKENGVMAIVLPEGIFVNPTYKYIRKFVWDNGEILSIVSIPTETFKPHTGIKTSILIFRKTSNKTSNQVRFFDVRKIGHDKNGKILYKYDKFGDNLKNERGEFIVDDELQDLLNESWNNRLYNEGSKLKTFIVPNSKIHKKNIWLYPKYYSDYLSDFEKYSYDNLKNYVFTIQEMIDKEIIEKTPKNLLPTGMGVESHMYDKNGEIPFIRTSDLKNLEIVRNPQKYISMQHYNEIKHKCDIKPYDILFAKDGDHLVGETAIIVPGEEKMIIQSHIYKIRVLKNEYGITSFNLLKALNEEQTIKQIKSLILVQGTIPSISQNIYEVKLKFSKNRNSLRAQHNEWKNMLNTKYMIKNKIKVKW